MKKIEIGNTVFGPYIEVDELPDRYRCDGADLPFSVIGRGVVSDANLGDFPAQMPSQSEIELIKTEAREKRNILLPESDWTQVADAPVDKSAWASYRQALRDLPQQAGFPVTIDWPVKP